MMRLAILIIPPILTATIGAHALGFAAPLTICVIVGFAVVASGWTIGGKTLIPAHRPASVSGKSLRK